MRSSFEPSRRTPGAIAQQVTVSASSGGRTAISCPFSRRRQACLTSRWRRHSVRSVRFAEVWKSK
jgi:hypothetical protein